MENTIEMKKDFAKVVKKIREAINQNKGTKSDYPKAMMTGQQIKNRTATVNCGEYSEDSIRMLAIARDKMDTVLTDPDFIEFIEKYNAVALPQFVKASGYSKYQVRINF